MFTVRRHKLNEDSLVGEDELMAQRALVEAKRVQWE
jgi:hypothetical protein